MLNDIEDVFISNDQKELKSIELSHRFTTIVSYFRKNVSTIAMFH